MIETRFKDTELGKIPEDWESGKFQDFLATFSSGATPYRGIPDNFKGDVRWISSGELNYNIINETLEHISHEAVVRTNLKIHQPGTFLMAITGLEAAGTRGKCAIVGKPSTTNQSCLALNSTDKMGTDYLYWFYNFYSETLAFKYAQGTKQQSFTADIVRKLPIYCPKEKSEQTRIATSLSNIDALISELGRLIDKKRAIKQGAIQQLLTGKKRLKGFTGPWVEKKLGEIGRTYSGLTGKTKSDFGEGNALYITFLNVLNNPILRPSLFESVKVDEGERQNHAVKGDLFFNTSSETPEEVGICSMLNHTVDNLYLNSFCFGYRLMDNDVAPEYLAYYFRSKEGRKLMTLLAQGVTRFNLSKSAFINASITIPTTKEEQISIASVFRKMDNEISALESKKAKYEQIKQGMMQQLLTGKIRLVETVAKTNMTSANIHFRRSVLAAEIAERLYEEPTFGHVKMEKMLFLTERLCHIDIGSHYHRDAAGPYDNRALRSIDSQLKKQKWFEVRRTEKGNRYVPMQNRGKHKTYFDKYFSAILPTFDKIIDTFKTQNTERCEIVATLYSAWEDLLHSNKPFTDADIVNEVLNNWHESKKRISKERWLSAIQWMRENGFAPNV